MNWFTMNEILGQVKLVEGGFYLLVKCILLNGSKDQICPCHVTCDWSFLAKFGAQPDIQKCLWFIFFVVITQLEQILPKKTDSLCLKFFSIYGGGSILIYPILYTYVTSKANFFHCIEVIFCGIQRCWSDDWQVSTGGMAFHSIYADCRYNTSS